MMRRLLILALLFPACLYAQVTCGNTTLFSSNASQSGTMQAAAICTPAANSSVTDGQIGFRSGSTGTAQLAIYQDNGGAFSTFPLVCYGTCNAVATGFCTVTFSPSCPPLTGGTNYWLATDAATASPQFAFTGSGTSHFNSQACCAPGSPPSNPFGTNSTAGNTFSVFLDIVALPSVRHQAVTVASVNSRAPYPVLAPLPPMGYNAFRFCGNTCTISQVENNCDEMVTNGMFAAGYTICSPDDSYSTARTGGSCSPIAVNAAFGGTSMAPFCSHVAGDGEVCGLYLSYGSCVAFPGSNGCETQDAAQTVGWGAGFIKYDSCTSFGSPAAAQLVYQTMDNAIRAVSSSVLYEVSMDPLNPTYLQASWGGAVGGSTTLVGSDGGNMTFTSMMTQVDAVNGLTRCGAPGCWNFIDLLGVGNGTLTDDEGVTNMAMWAMFASPLMASIDLTAPPSSPTLATLKNANIIAIDQDPLGILGAQRTSVSCGSATCQTYSRPIQAGGVAWAALNRASTTQSITITFTGTLNFYDLVAGSSIGAETGTYTPSVVSHGTAFLAACAGATNWNASTHKCQ